MKTSFYCLLCGFLFQAYPMLGQSKEHLVKVIPKVDEVIVYFNGSELHSDESIELRKGKNTVIFAGLSPHLQANSVQIRVSESQELLSVSTREHSIRATEANPMLKAMQDSITFLDQKLAWVNNEIDAYDFEKSTLEQNKNLRTNTGGVSIAELSKASEFFRERVLKINNALTLLERKKTLLREQVEAWEAEFQKAVSKTTLARKEVTLVLLSNTDQKANIQLRYLVSQAGWSATYDLIATDVSKPISLKYQAQIFNNTEINWENVNLVLSTADPSASASRPYLTTWNLNYHSDANEGLLDTKAPGKKASVADSTVDYEVTTISELNTTISIPKKYSIPADGVPFVIDVSTTPLQASYEYLTIPKVDMSAFLIAKVTGWESMNLMSGRANVYFGHAYMGETQLDTRQLGDTLELSLGRDNQIQVTRTKLKDFAGSKFIGIKKEESFKYEIQVKNNRSIPVQLRIQDQVPLSQEDNISVEIEEVSGASVDAESGRLQWNTVIAPGDAPKYTIAFSVKYPKNKELSLRKRRIVRTPKFRH